mgnify:CR=1 FL=1
MFQHVEFYPGDPILSLVETFQADKRPEKVNLGIGIYLDEAGRLPVLSSVRTAEVARAAVAQPRSYLPMEGLEAFRHGVQRLLFGAEHPALQEGRIATIQTLGGSGALKIGADFLARWFPEAKVYVSDPTWDNHKGIFRGAGFEVGVYPYYDPATGGLKFDEMLAFFAALPRNSMLVLHPCCHNPTGADLMQSQWREIIEVMRARGLVPFLDMAYQGFADGIAEDALALNLFAASGMQFFVSSSFSKSFSLYGERVGALSVVCSSKDEAARVLSQLKLTIRTNYSNPPTHGAAVVSAVLNTPEWRALWEKELGEMRTRIKAMRQALADGLKAAGVTQDMSFIVNQVGMFSYSGLSKEQMQRLRSEFGVYGTDSGRLCVAALNSRNIDHVCQAIAAVMK